MLFSAPMVRANRAGIKTQTRRLVKPQPEWLDGPQRWRWPIPKKHVQPHCSPYAVTASREWWEYVPLDGLPYGHASDRLWGREAFSGPRELDKVPPRDWPRDSPIWYWADGNPQHGDWTRPRPGIHMPRWASRIQLELTSVRAERLQDISEKDAAAEGVEPLDSEACAEGNRPSEFHHWMCGNCGGRRLYDAIGPGYGVMPDTDCRECDTHVKRYRWLWESINGEGSWVLNPWVWVLEFKRVER